MRKFTLPFKCLLVGIILAFQACSFKPKENVDLIYSHPESMDELGLMLSSPMGMAKSIPLIDETFGLKIGNPDSASAIGISSFRMFPQKSDYDPFKTMDNYSNYGLQLHKVNKAEPGYQSFQLEQNIELEQTALSDVLLQRLIIKDKSACSILFDFSSAAADTSREVYLISEDSGWIKGFILDKNQEQYSRLFFFIRFSIPYMDVRVQEDENWFLYLNREFRGNDLKTLFYFSEGIDTLMVKIGFSTASIDAAHAASQTVVKWKFDDNQTKSRTNWIRALGKDPLEEMSQDEISVLYRSRFQLLGKVFQISDTYEESFFKNGQINRSPYFIRYISADPEKDFYAISQFSTENPVLKEDLVLSLLCEVAGDSLVSSWIDGIGRRPEGTEMLEFIKNPQFSFEKSVVDAAVSILNPGYLD